VVTPGGKPVLTFAVLACVNPGDEVIVPNPGFPIYESAVRFAGGTPVSLALREERGFRFGAADVEALLTPRTKMLILNSPHNPTGSVLAPGDLDQIAALLRDRDIWVLSDEIYSKILYDGVHESIATRPGMQERTILLDGFSKTYAMTGWRLGFSIWPKALIEHATRLAINCHSCVNAPTQFAGIAALNGPQDEALKMVKAFDARRKVVVEELNKLPGVSCVEPGGAFYAFPNISRTGLKAKEFERRLLEDAGVATVAGTSFGSYGEGYLRLSYANSTENIREAIGRMDGWLRSLPKAE
jgi:aspartate aminotransferase